MYLYYRVILDFLPQVKPLKDGFRDDKQSELVFHKWCG